MTFAVANCIIYQYTLGVFQDRHRNYRMLVRVNIELSAGIQLVIRNQPNQLQLHIEMNGCNRQSSQLAHYLLQFIVIQLQSCSRPAPAPVRARVRKARLFQLRPHLELRTGFNFCCKFCSVFAHLVACLCFFSLPVFFFFVYGAIWQTP